jgi:hypothetical protein
LRAHTQLKEYTMLNSKTLLTYLLTLCVGFMMTACPDDECGSDEAGAEAGAEGGAEAGGEDTCEEAGTEEGGTEEGGSEAGSEAGSEVEVTTYELVVVKDTSTEINADGTPGADLCEVDVVCDGESLGGDRTVNIDTGSSPACDGSNAENCVCPGNGFTDAPCSSGKDRSNEQVVFDGDASCEGDNYAALGIDGTFTIELEEIATCGTVSVSVTEKAGAENEQYIVALCDSAASLEFSDMMFGDDCALIGSAEATMGDGEAVTQDFSWEAPAAEEPAAEE